MRNQTMWMAAVAAASLINVARADDGKSTRLDASPGKTIGIDGGAALPVGTWGDAAGFGFGVLGRFEMPLAPALTLTARAGLFHHLSKDGPAGVGGMASSSATEVPLFGGVRYAFSRQPGGEIYGAAELGLVYYSVSTDVGGMSSSGSNTNLGMTLGAGYRAGKLDLRGGLLFPDLGHVGDAIGLMATVGYELTTL